ncbi:MAG: glutathione S-transferase [Pseudomonadota bacterium]|nr:glutathione S-transferase [Pseudomonadota bacterium]
MILRSSPASPYGRKCKMSAIVLGVMDKIEVVKADTRDANDSIRKQNPLGKIPALILDDGTVLFDSPVICEYLDSLAGGGKILPKTGAARWKALRLEALADGILDAALLQVYEKRYRPENIQHKPWVEMQQDKVQRALDHLEASVPAKVKGLPDIGQITLACALGYLDFRFEGKWRAAHPKLVGWLSDYEAAVPAFAKTVPHD